MKISKVSHTTQEPSCLEFERGWAANFSPMWHSHTSVDQVNTDLGQSVHCPDCLRFSQSFLMNWYTFLGSNSDIMDHLLKELMCSAWTLS